VKALFRPKPRRFPGEAPIGPASGPADDHEERTPSSRPPVQ
jgi:hypothetical protein